MDVPYNNHRFMRHPPIAHRSTFMWMKFFTVGIQHEHTRYMLCTYRTMTTDVCAPPDRPHEDS